MSPADATSEDRHGRILAELAGLSLELARDLQARALAAETAEEAAQLSSAFHRIARGLRQTLALELKIVRDKDAAAREAAEAAAADQAARALQAEMTARAVARRRQDVRERIDDAFWNEAEPAERLEVPDGLWQRLDAWLDAAQQDADFLTADFDLQVIAACEAIGLDPARLYDIVDRRAPEAELDCEPAAADSS